MGCQSMLSSSEPLLSILDFQICLFSDSGQPATRTDVPTDATNETLYSKQSTGIHTFICFPIHVPLFHSISSPPSLVNGYGQPHIYYMCYTNIKAISQSHFF